MREDDKVEELYKIISFDYMSLYPEVYNFVDDDMIREFNKKKLKEDRIKKLDILNNL